MEGPETKRLKSESGLPPLAPGWTEHTAPTGHKYYYHAETKKSTYTRPVVQQAAPPYLPPSAPPPVAAPNVGQSYDWGYQGLQDSNANHGNSAYGQQAPTWKPPAHFNAFPQSHSYPQAASYAQRPVQTQRPQIPDRPKRKAVIPDCAPWILVYTKLGRRFVHNLETQESFWKFPEHVMKAVIEFDRLEWEKKRDGAGAGQGAGKSTTGANREPLGRDRRRRSESLQREDEQALAAELEHLEYGKGEDPSGTLGDVANPPRTQTQDANGKDDEGSSSEYEEIEVTDDEDEEGEPNNGNPEGDPSAEPGPVEFDEDDIAYQLAAMGESYGLDPGEYDDGTAGEDYEEGAEGLPLTEEDSTALFRDLLDDWRINPYTPFETIIDNGTIIDDERYTVLPTMRARKEVWSTWSRERIASLRLLRETAERQDPRIPYLAFLAEHATPKLYWPEFRRKHKKAPEMRDAKISDKEREKLYREHINRLKTPASQLQKDLLELMRGLPLRVLNRDSSFEALPKEMLTDLRFISLVPSVRDPIVRNFIENLEPAPVDEGEDVEAQEMRERKRDEREKRERALRERERRVEEEKRARDRELRAGMGRLREGEREIEAAMKVGRDGLKAQLGGGDDSGKGDGVPS